MASIYTCPTSGHPPSCAVLSHIVISSSHSLPLLATLQAAPSPALHLVAHTSESQPASLSHPHPTCQWISHPPTHLHLPGVPLPTCPITWATLRAACPPTPFLTRLDPPTCTSLTSCLAPTPNYPYCKPVQEHSGSGKSYKGHWQTQRVSDYIALALLKPKSRCIGFLRPCFNYSSSPSNPHSALEKQWQKQIPSSSPLSCMATISTSHKCIKDHITFIDTHASNSLLYPVYVALRTQTSSPSALLSIILQTPPRPATLLFPHLQLLLPPAPSTAVPTPSRQARTTCLLPNSHLRFPLLRTGPTTPPSSNIPSST